MNPEDRVSSETEPRRPYQTPRLIVYGDAKVLTLKNGGRLNMNDGGSGPDKTGF